MRIFCRSFMTFGVPYFQTNPFYSEMGWPGVYWERASRMRQRPSSTHGEESLKRLVIPDLVDIQTFLLGPSATWPVATLGMICHWDMHPHADMQFFTLSQMYHEWRQRNHPQESLSPGLHPACHGLWSVHPAFSGQSWNTLVEASLQLPWPTVDGPWPSEDWSTGPSTVSSWVKTLVPLLFTSSHSWVKMDVNNPLKMYQKRYWPIPIWQWLGKGFSDTWS